MFFKKLRLEEINFRNTSLGEISFNKRFFQEGTEEIFFREKSFKNALSVECPFDRFL